MINLSSISIDNQFGIHPLLELEIDWDGTTVRYSTDEKTGPVYGYVKTFSDLSLVSQVEGLGQVNSVKVTMFDLFGHFKTQYQNNDVYSKQVTATLYMTSLSSANRVQLFTGRIENVTWRQSEKEFVFDVVSEIVEGKIGYTPKISDIDSGDSLYNFYSEYLNEQAWPNSFGVVKNVEATRLNNINDTVKTTAEQRIGSIATNADDWAGSLSVTENAKDIYPLNTDLDVYIYTKEMIIQATGQFKSGDTFDITTGNISINLWEGSISCTLDSITRIIEPTLASDPGIPLTGLYAKFAWAFISGGSCVGGSSGTFNFKVLEQNELKLKLDMKYTYLTDDSSPLECSETMDLTEIFFHDQWQTNFVIPEGANFYVKGQTNYNVYVVDIKDDVTVDEVRIQLKDDETEVVPVTDYTVKNNTANGNFWTTDSNGEQHPASTYLEMGDGSFLRFFWDFQSGDDVKEGILVDVTTTQTTALDVITYLADQLSWSTSLQSASENATAISFSSSDEEDISEWITEIAWQAMYGLRVSGTTLQVFNLNNPFSTVDTISGGEIEHNSVSIFPSNQDDLVTRFQVTAQYQDLLAELDEFKVSQNVSKYGELIEDIDVYLFTERSDADTCVNYWISRYSDVEDMVEFTGPIHLMALEIWDRVAITLPTISFASNAPLTNKHSPASSVWSINALIVKEVNIDLVENRVTILGRKTS